MNYKVILDSKFDISKLIGNGAEFQFVSPDVESFCKAIKSTAEHIFIVTQSYLKSENYYSAIKAVDMCEGTNSNLQIHVIDLDSSTCSEEQIAGEITRLESKGYLFDEIVGRLEVFRNSFHVSLA